MKYFIVSDIHSFYDALIKGLKEKGYDKNNPNHTLVIIGDIFDRGSKPIELYKFLTSINENNLILIKGNHDDAFIHMLDEIPTYADFYNGTVETFCKIASSESEINYQIDIMDLYDNNFENKFSLVQYEVKHSKIASFMKSDRWHNFYEIGNYVLVHGFIPTNELGYCSSWREEKDNDVWEKARWDYGHICYNDGLFDEEIKNDKVLVVGHVSTSYISHYFNKPSSSDIFYSKNFIAIDGCVALSHKMNVLVLEDDGKNIKLVK